MKRYFENKIGEKIKKVVNTGETFFTKVYQRNYFIEVLDVKGDTLVVEVESYDVTPSNMKNGGSEKYFGEFSITIGEKSKSDILLEIIEKADPVFNVLLNYNKEA